MGKCSSKPKASASSHGTATAGTGLDGCGENNGGGDSQEDDDVPPKLHQSMRARCWLWERIVTRMEEHRIVVRNASRFAVSISVVQEDKLVTVARQTQVTRRHQGGLGIAALGVAPSLGATLSGGKSTVETSDDEIQEPYIVTKDARIPPREGSIIDSISVNFPEDCKTLRVYGHFRGEDGKWKLYKNSTHSIGFKKEITITATNQKLNLYQRECQQGSR